MKNTKKKNEKFKLIKILCLMYVLFPFKLKGVAMAQNVVYYSITTLFTIYFIYKLFSTKVNKSYVTRYLLFLLLFLSLTIISVLIPFFKRTGDYSYASQIMYYWGRTFILTGTALLSKSVLEYIDLTIDAINSYVIFSIILLIPRIHSFYMGILDSSTLTSNRMEELYSQNYYTRFGLQGFSGFGSTVMCTLAVLLCCFMLVNKISKNESVKKYIIRMVLSLVGTALYGRIGLSVSFLLIVVTLVYLAIKYNKFVLLFGASLVVVLLAILFIINANYLQQISSIRWMFEGVFNYLNYGTFTTKSTDDLGNMYFWPGIKTFFWGDGYYTIAGRYYMGTDVGILRPLLFGGIYFELFYYLSIFPLLAVINREFKKLNGKFLIFIVLLSLMFFEFKGEVLLTFSNTIYSLVCSILISKHVNVK